MLVAVIGILAAAAIPALLTFYRAQQLDGAARRVATYLQEGRQLAISLNSRFRVDVDTAGNQIRYVCVSPGPSGLGCGGTAAAPRVALNAAWTGAGTNAQGYRGLDPDYSVDACSRTTFTFTPLGTLDTTATPAGAVRVRNAANTQRLDVTVNATGRVATGAAGTCP